jgi:DNA-binding response OmpR family regulator
VRTKRILVVEDDPVTCEVVQVVLEDFGFELMVVQDVEQARQASRDAPPDLVLLDLTLPGGDALQLCAELKGQAADTCVVLMTHHLEEEEMARVVQSEADAQVTKPFSPLGLLAIVHECLQRQGAAGSVL